jgi:hypothetical protein
VISGWPLRLASIAAITSILGLAAVYQLHQAKEAGRNELRPEIKRLETALAFERADRARAEKAADSYRSEMDALARRAVPRAPVRLCVDTSAMPATVTTTTSADDRTSTSWGDLQPPRGDLAAGPDISAQLYQLAGACDAENAKLRALQGWLNDFR